MEVVSLTILMVLAVADTTQAQSLTKENSSNILSPYAKLNLRKREVTSINCDENFLKNLEMQLSQHTQALEQLLILTKSNEDLVKTLVQNLATRRSALEMPESPQKIEPVSRRSGSGGSQEAPVVPSRSNKMSPWCSLALLCESNNAPVCGFDNRFGHGKFTDICHMLHVNCYWNYGFVMVPKCMEKI